MKTRTWRALTCAVALAAAAALPAQADLVTFEDVVPTLFSGTSITSGRFNFQSDAFGFSGVDKAAAFSAFANAPANADGQFLFMLNNDGMVVTERNGQAFFLFGFDASFIAPVGGLGAGILPGELHLFGLEHGGGLVSDSFLFGASDVNGDFNFEAFGAGNLAGKSLTALGFLACVYDAGGCSFIGGTVQAQFALDNIRIPEPGTVALVASALLAGGISRRRLHASNQC